MSQELDIQRRESILCLGTKSFLIALLPKGSLQFTQVFFYFSPMVMQVLLLNQWNPSNGCPFHISPSLKIHMEHQHVILRLSWVLRIGISGREWSTASLQLNEKDLNESELPFYLYKKCIWPEFIDQLKNFLAL